MGRHCGWLGLMAAIATGADYLFIPEDPPKTDDWQSEMCEVIKRVGAQLCALHLPLDSAS